MKPIRKTAVIPTSTPELLDEHEVAAIIRMSVAYLRADRSRGHVGGATPGPPFLRIGRTIRYRRDDLDAWLADKRVDRSAGSQSSAQAVAA
jgi:hypothetical protein